jgi:hypothetical protein
MNSKTTNILLVVAIILVVVLIGVGLWLIFQGTSGSNVEPAAVPPTPIAEVETAVPTLAPPSPTAEQIVIVPPTATTIPTDVPTETPIPTDTPVPTETPLPTNTPVPIIYPTATPIPPTAPPEPTATTGPPPGPQPVSINGISGKKFEIQDRSSFCPNCDVWFRFVVSNSSGGNVSFSTLGVVPRKDGKDQWQWFQKSWGGNSDKIDKNGLDWEDHINIPESGDYTLRLVICFGEYNSCKAGNSTHHTLSQEIPITIK